MLAEVAVICAMRTLAVKWLPFLFLQAGLFSKKFIFPPYLALPCAILGLAIGAEASWVLFCFVLVCFVLFFKFAKRQGANSMYQL